MAYVLMKLYKDGKSILDIIKSADYPQYIFEVATGFKKDGRPKSKKYQNIKTRGVEYPVCITIFISGKSLFFKDINQDLILSLKIIDYNSLLSKIRAYVKMSLFLILWENFGNTIALNLFCDWLQPGRKKVNMKF